MSELLTPILAFIGLLTLGGGVILGLAARRGSLRRLKADRSNTEVDAPQEAGKCIFTGQTSPRRGVFARAY